MLEIQKYSQNGEERESGPTASISNTINVKNVTFTFKGERSGKYIITLTGIYLPKKL